MTLYDLRKLPPYRKSDICLVLISNFCLHVISQVYCVPQICQFLLKVSTKHNDIIYRSIKKHTFVQCIPLNTIIPFNIERAEFEFFIPMGISFHYQYKPSPVENSVFPTSVSFGSTSTCQKPLAKFRTLKNTLPRNVSMESSMRSNNLCKSLRVILFATLKSTTSLHVYCFELSGDFLLANNAGAAT